MANRLIGKCPVDDGEMIVSELRCPKCGTVIKGEFSLSAFDRLSEPEMKFAEVFLKNGGNIKGVEKELDISYPTVKKFLDQVLQALGLSSSEAFINKGQTREDILKSLKEGTISFDEAESMLKDIGESI